MLGKRFFQGGLSALLVLALMLGLLPVAALAANTRFGDMAEGATFYNEVTAAANLGLVGGYEDGTFRPGNNLTNGAFVKMTAAAFTQIGGYPTPYVAQVGAFASSVAFVRERAEKLGKASPELSAILNNPSNAATRHNAIVVLDAVTPDKEYERPSMRGFPPTLGGWFREPFSDANQDLMNKISTVNGGWNSRSIIGGYPDNTVRAESQLTRGQGVALVMRYAQLRLLDVVASDIQNSIVSYSDFTCAKNTPSAVTALLIVAFQNEWEYTGCNPGQIGFDTEVSERIVQEYPRVMALSVSRGSAFTNDNPVEFLDLWMDNESGYTAFSYDKWVSMTEEEVEIVGRDTSYDELLALITAPRNGGNVVIQPVAPETPVKIQPAPSDPSISPVNPGVPEEEYEKSEPVTEGGDVAELRGKLLNMSVSDTANFADVLAHYMVAMGYDDVEITTTHGGDYDGQRCVRGDSGAILSVFVYNGTLSSYRAAGHGVIGITAMTDHPDVMDLLNEVDAMSGHSRILPVPHEPDMTIQPAPEDSIDVTVTTAIPSVYQGLMLGAAAA